MSHAHDLDLAGCLYYYCYLKLRNALNYQSDDPINNLNNNLYWIKILLQVHSLYNHLKKICCDLMNETYLVVDLYLNDDVNN